MHQTLARRRQSIDCEVPQLIESLMDLVQLRVAQIHDCQSCIKEHTKELKARGEADLRLNLLKDWRTQAAFSDREEAALNLAEAITYQPIDSVPAEHLRVTRLFFNDSEMIRLTLAILAVNDWHYLNPKNVPTGE